MKKEFDALAFNAELTIKLEQLGNAEKITKPLLSELSRSILEFQHASGDIQPVNRLLAVLTPANKRIAVLFFQHFSGHLYSEKEESFGKRDKKHYEAKYKLSEEFLNDPHNNIWTWQARHVEMEAKPFALLKVSKFIESALKKAKDAGFSQADVVRACLAGGLEVEALLAILQEQANVEVNIVEAEQAEAVME